MEDLYPVVEEGPKYRGKQSIKGRFEPRVYKGTLNAQLRRKKKIFFFGTTHLGVPGGKQYDDTSKQVLVPKRGKKKYQHFLCVLK